MKSNKTKYLFNLKSLQVEIEQHPDHPGMFHITKGCKFITQCLIFRMDDLKKHFRPADCEALDLVDPDRNERLSE